MMKRLAFLFLFFFIPVQSWALFGKKQNPEKFFDLDKNGWLNPYERALLATYNRFHWEMADSKKKKKFDYNQDSMLEPREWADYLEFKKGKEKQEAPFNGRIRF